MNDLALQPAWKSSRSSEEDMTDLSLPKISRSHLQEFSEKSTNFFEDLDKEEPICSPQ